MDDTMGAVSQSTERQVTGKLGSPEIRRLVEQFVRRRVPAGEVDDIVQTVLCDALASDAIPSDDDQLRRWLMGITRHKVADFHRGGARAGRHEELGEAPAESAPLEARAMARWAEKQTEGDAEAERTLDWMAREGGGEKLAHIAADAKVSPELVRQRVSRMRRFMRDKWAAELAAVAVVLGMALVLWWVLRRDEPTATPVPQPAPEHVLDPRLEKAHELRKEALAECDRSEWQKCLAGLDEAAKLDPEGDRDAAVQDARREAAAALEEQSKEQTKEPVQTKEPEKEPAPPRSVDSSSTPPAPPPPPKPQNIKQPPSDKEKLIEEKKRASKPEATPPPSPPPAEPAPPQAPLPEEKPRKGGKKGGTTDSDAKKSTDL
jgi:DNA-directed RNA polymerase specialized sigma24 family protein